ncbi:MAG: ABC transporter permease [Clostridia bacterium]|nr:ABC transporter permease [Clostridia bacterium]
MLNQLRADYYRLFHSKLCWVVGSVFTVFLIISAKMSMGKTVFIFGGVMGHKDGIPLLDGFIGFAYKNPVKPLFWELVYSSTAFTGLLWLVFMSLSVQFISKEYQTGTIKLAVSYGASVFKIYLSKWIVVVSFSGLLFYVYNLATFAVVCGVKNYVPTFGNWISLLALVSLYILVLAVFTLFCFTLYIAFKNTVAVLTIVPLFMFSMIIVINTFRTSSFLVNCYLRINPMYYLSNASRFWADSAIAKNILLFAAAGIALLLVSSYFLLKKQEIK